MISLLVALIMAAIIATITYSSYQVIEPDGTVLPIEEKASEIINDLNEKKEKEAKDTFLYDF